VLTEVRCLQRSAVAGPRVSVLVRVRNEMTALPHFWKMLQEQTIFASTEILFLDNGSTDGSLEFLQQKPCSLYQLEGEFNYGRSCNQIAAQASAPILVYLSGHVLLEQKDALEQIAALLEKHSKGAACLRQVPNTVFGCSTYEAVFLKRRFPAGEKTTLLKTPLLFSNAASAITRASWQAHPFEEIHGREDFLWVKEHLACGGQLFYMPQLLAMHSHNNESPAMVYKRVRSITEGSFQTRRYAKAVYLFAGVYVTMRRAGAPHGEALSYASAHARAYL
jgi:glycosyltransferase involved in cell wall biosynthesis